MRWVGYVARMWLMSAYNVLVERPGGKRPLGDLGVDGRMKFKILNKWSMGM